MAHQQGIRIAQSCAADPRAAVAELAAGLAQPALALVIFFKTQHFVPSDERLVVTAADPARRLVSEINGSPAAAEYARILGVSAAELAPESFAASPMVVLIADTEKVRRASAPPPRHQRRHTPPVGLVQRAKHLRQARLLAGDEAPVQP